MLPQLQEKTFLMDGGLETTLIFFEGVELRDFAAFELFETPEGRARVEAYFRRHADIARAEGLGFIFEAPTWRASADWGARLGYDRTALHRINTAAIGMMRRLRDEYAQNSAVSGVVSGCIGPRGDGYAPSRHISPEVAQCYHRDQLVSFAEAGAEMASALTMTHPDEAIGIVRAAQAAGLPIVIGFTVEIDGRLPSGVELPVAIRRVDDETGGAVAYFLINCAHPDHFRNVLEEGGDWLTRIRGLRANASRCSHAELNESATLDDGDPTELATDYVALRQLLPDLTVLGGCCGTDYRHIEAIAAAFRAASSPVSPSPHYPGTRGNGPSQIGVSLHTSYQTASSTIVEAGQ